jgi:IMP dehydrogenase/GMP reductase
MIVMAENCFTVTYAQPHEKVRILLYYVYQVMIIHTDSRTTEKDNDHNYVPYSQVSAFAKPTIDKEKRLLKF